MEATIWEAWVGDLSPLAFLAATDREVVAGKFPSRRAVFLDHAQRMLRTRWPDLVGDWTPQSLADALLAFAEEFEQGGGL